MNQNILFQLFSVIGNELIRKKNMNTKHIEISHLGKIKMRKLFMISITIKT